MKVNQVLSSNNVSNLAYYLYEVENPIGVVQITHGMCEYIKRYEHFINFLNENGYAVIAHDHLGHGYTGDLNNDFGYFSKKKGYKVLVEDLNIISKFAKEIYPNIQLILFGHSMGSFITRCYLTKYSNNINGVVICGTGGKVPFISLGVKLAKIIKLFKGERHISKFIYKMSTGNFNKKHKEGPKGNGVEWLTRDVDVQYAYLNDKYCKIKFTTSAYVDLFSLFAICNKKSWYKKFDIPIYLISGDKDPVGNNGKGVTQVYKNLSKKNETYIKLYKDDRHEILNELNQDEVYNDILNFIKQKVSIF